MQQPTSTPEIIKVSSLPIGARGNYAISQIRNNANFHRFFNIETTEYYLGVIEILLALRFVLEFFSGYSRELFVTIYSNITLPLVIPFSNILGPNFDGGIERFEQDTLIAMLSWGLAVWIGIGIIKFREHRQKISEIT